MTPVVRRLEAHELPLWLQCVPIPFLMPPRDDDGEPAPPGHWERHMELDRTWAVEDEGRFVGNGTTFSRTVTLPAATGSGCPVVPMAAFTGVGVQPTHTRRGLLRALMTEMLEDARGRDEPLAGLMASEGSIYGRFGFGVATTAARYSIDTRDATFARPFDGPPVRLVGPNEAAELLPELFQGACAVQPGQVNRTDAVWTELFEDNPERRHGASPNWYGVCEGGYAIWRVEARRTFSAASVTVVELVADRPQSEAALWRFILNLDMVSDVVTARRPVEEPLRYRLADPRSLKTQEVRDVLWLRILDTPAALCARQYERDGELVLEVTSPQPDDPAAGRWVLHAESGKASCAPAGRSQAVDLSLGLAELSAMLAGGVKASVLCAGGLVDEGRLGALAEADALFMSTPAPFTIVGF
ncbi:MAG: GNAT family N-acetyltransferase [Acidimicrobiales bacterium]